LALRLLSVRGLLPLPTEEVDPAASGRAYGGWKTGGMGPPAPIPFIMPPLTFIPFIMPPFMPPPLIMGPPAGKPTGVLGCELAS
jgi:hypothetical protein